MNDDLLAECRSRIGTAPRRFTLLARLFYLRTPHPWWMWLKPDDLETFFRNRGRLLRDGVVVWAHIVQANSLMFSGEPGTGRGLNCPGEVVYCADPRSDISPAELRPIARALFALKGAAQTEEAHQFIADYLANERMRVFGLPVPAAISGDYPCRISTVFFNRRHIPGGFLRKSYFPLLLSTSAPNVAMVLPERYWPPLFAARWKGS